jgi:DNA-binding transcriptional ArsR family regulator
MAKVPLTPDVLSLVADRLKGLAEPARLQILNALRQGERSVTELMEATGLGQANLSRHLRILHTLGFVARRKEGLFVYYSLADDSVFRICDVICDRLGDELKKRRKLLAF